MKELRFVAIIKNNRLLQRREELKLSRSQLCKLIKIGQTHYGQLENCKLIPRGKRVKWLAIAQRLADFYYCEPEELFPEAIEKIKETQIEKKFDFNELPLLQSQLKELPSPEDICENNELKKNISSVLATLPKREQEVLELRFGLNGSDELTLEECEKRFGVTRERVRQIEMKALRHLRHPCRAKKLHVGGI